MEKNKPEEGDQVLVDTSDYNIEGEHWCEVTHTRYWAATPYPVKVKLPRYGSGQYSLDEIIDVKTEES